MKSQKHGKSTLRKVEVTGITQNGIWLLAFDHEYFLSYDHYPWFKKALVEEIYNMKLIHENQLNWPDLDVDLELNCLIHPEKYPLKYIE